MYIREKCSPFTQYSMKCRGSFTNAEYSKHFVLCRVGWQECGLFFQNKILKEHILHNSECKGTQCIFCKGSVPMYELHKCICLHRVFILLNVTFEFGERHFLKVFRHVRFKKNCCSNCPKFIMSHLRCAEKRIKDCQEMILLKLFLPICKFIL